MKRLFLLLAAWCCLGLGTVLAYNPYAPNQFALRNLDNFLSE